MENEIMNFKTLMFFDMGLFFVALIFSAAGWLRSVVVTPYKNGKMTIDDLKKNMIDSEIHNKNRVESAKVLFKFTRLFIAVWVIFTCFLVIQYQLL